MQPRSLQISGTGTFNLGFNKASWASLLAPEGGDVWSWREDEMELMCGTPPGALLPHRLGGVFGPGYQNREICGSPRSGGWSSSAEEQLLTVQRRTGRRAALAKA